METVRVFIVQDRQTGHFFDLNMLPVKSLRHAARAESLQIAHESMATAIIDGLIEVPDGYEVHQLFELIE